MLTPASVARHYTLSSPLAVAPAGPVLPRELLGAVRTAADLLKRAEARRDAVLQEAEAAAREIAATARREAEADVWRQAREALAALRRLREELEASAQSLLARLGATALRRLRVDVDSVAQSLSGTLLLLEEWQGWCSTEPVQLRVHPDAHAAVARAVAHVPEFTVVAAPAMAPGDCLLVGSQLEVRASFTGSVDALLRALAAEQPPAPAGDAPPAEAAEAA